MKITYFVRDQRKGNYSLEKIFKEIGDIMSLDHQVRYFYVDPDRSKAWNIKQAQKIQGDVNHITGDVNWLAFGLDKKKTILTVHDIGHYVNTLKGIKKVLYGKFWWEWPVKRVAFLTSISEFTKQELISKFHIPAGKIITIYNPLWNNFEMIPKKFNKTKPSILQVGSMPNKNTLNLIEAVKDLPCTLHLLRPKDQHLEKVLKDLNICYHFYDDLTEEKVVKLYANIDILYFASTYEGFGLPIIEAQAVGRPVLTSNICSMPEVAGKGACFVDPFSVDDIKIGIKKIIHEDDYRKEIIDHGLSNIKRFEIGKIAERYQSLYNELIRN